MPGGVPLFFCVGWGGLPAGRIVPFVLQDMIRWVRLNSPVGRPEAMPAVAPRYTELFIYLGWGD